MRVLAIDTALAACSAAVLDTEHGGIVASESLPMVRGHAEALLPLVQRVMQAAGLTFPDIDRIAVTTGPGSFTGLRVGIAAARGIALAADKPAVGVSTLSAYAAPHVADDERFPVVAAIDARHGHVYLQVFAPGGRSFTAPRLAPLREAVRAAAETSSCIAGSAARLVAEGLAAEGLAADGLTSESLPPEGLTTDGLTNGPVPVVVDASPAPDIGWVARMGAVVPPEQAPLKPQYLRAPDAQPQNAAQLPRR
jgi:tRNA threonylcarbamoyladenosine biosynthesis protein TsaB